MISKEQKVRLGVFLLVSSVLLTIILAIFIIPKLKDKGDIYYINFRGYSVNGVSEGADVKYQGVRIGKVTRLEVNAEDLNSIFIYVKLKKGFPVKEDMRAALQYAGITGLRFIEISGGSPETKSVEPEGEIKPKKGLGEKAEDIVLNVDSVVEAINEMLNPENREKVSQLLINLEKSTRVISNVLERREQNIGSSMEKMEEAMGQITEVAKNLKDFTAYLNGLTRKGKIDSLLNESEELVKNLKQRVSAQEMGKVMERMNTLMDTATDSIKKIENQFYKLEGNFSETLSSLKESMENITRFTRELTEDPTLLLRKRAGKRSRK
jgi:phospholipid/cholesterol/gamma-HCH transport system substrate-binding protein